MVSHLHQVDDSFLKSGSLHLVRPFPQFADAFIYSLLFFETAGAACAFCIAGGGTGYCLAGAFSASSAECFVPTVRQRGHGPIFAM